MILVTSSVLAVIILVPALCVCLTGVILAGLLDPKYGLLRDRASDERGQ